MSPRLHDMAIIRDMQQALRMLEAIDTRQLRFWAYVRAGFTDYQIVLHDREAYRTERLRRSIYGESKWKASQSALA